MQYSVPRIRTRWWQCLPTFVNMAIDQYQLGRAVHAALVSPEGAPIAEDTLRIILHAWGDNTVRADDPCLQTMLEEAARAKGPIVQCGCNAFTLLLAIVAQRTRKYLWILEHDAHWASAMQRSLTRHGIGAGNVVHAPAEAFGDHLWYVIDMKRLPRDIAMVVCEGSNVLPNGVRGVAQRLATRLDHRCVLIVRNTHRPRDLNYLAKWAKSRGAPFILNDKREPFVKIALRDQTSNEEYASDRVLTVYGKALGAEMVVKRRTPRKTRSRRSPKAAKPRERAGP